MKTRRGDERVMFVGSEISDAVALLVVFTRIAMCNDSNVTER